MSKPYTLLLCSNLPDELLDLRGSVQMNAHGLKCEFEKLHHVDLRYQNCLWEVSEFQSADFALIHMYYDREIFTKLSDLRKVIKNKIMVIMECPFHSDIVDHQFLFNPIFKSRTDTTIVEFPYIKELLDITKFVPKKQGSILIDHVWPSGTCSTDYSSLIYEWLYPIKDGRLISQMGKSGCDELEKFPSWINKIPETPYLEYLSNTAKFENYILTHNESYGHSIIDMAYRGIRVIVPVINDTPVCQPCLIESLNLPMFSNADELKQILETPICNIDNPSTFTDMKTIVSTIDDYCQKVINNE